MAIPAFPSTVERREFLNPVPVSSLDSSLFLWTTSSSNLFTEDEQTFHFLKPGLAQERCDFHLHSLCVSGPDSEEMVFSEGGGLTRGAASKGAGGDRGSGKKVIVWRRRVLTDSVVRSSQSLWGRAGSTGKSKDR